MVRAKVVTVLGTKVEINDGTPKEIAETVHRIEEPLRATASAKKKTKKKTQGKKDKRDIKNRILDLKAQGFFASPRSLPEIKDALRQKWGYVLKSNQISPRLTALVRNGELRREGDPGKYKYYEPT